jgi:hypothetical protein
VGSRNQASSIVAVSGRRGVHRCFRLYRTWTDHTKVVESVLRKSVKSAIGFPLGLWRNHSPLFTSREGKTLGLSAGSPRRGEDSSDAGRQFSESRSPYRVGIVGRRYEWRQEPARKSGGQRAAAGMSSAILSERRISGISTVANQSYRSGHAQPKCLHDLQNACEAGALVLGRLPCGEYLR